MKIRLHSWVLSVLIWLNFASSSLSAEDGRSLLTEIMEKPGSWNQMCGLPGPIALDVPVPLFTGSIVPKYFNLVPRESQRLQAARAAVVPALLDFLKAMDLAKPPKETRGKENAGFTDMRSGFKADWLNSLHLQIIGDLNAVETLPELLRLEAQLHGMLEAAQKEPKSPLPPLALDSPGLFTRPAEKSKLPLDQYWASTDFKRDRAVFTCRIMQREMLGTITLLLQREQWPGLKERFVAEHRQATEQQLAKARANLATAKAALAQNANAGPKLQAHVKTCEDTVKELEAGTAAVSTTAPYTPALRGDIRTMAETFLKTVPPEKRRAAAAMPKHEDSP